jgi:hypothetical protein
MKTPLIFKIGLKENLNIQQIKEGSLYFTEDTCELFFDTQNDRKQWIPNLECIMHESTEEVSFIEEESE